MSRNRVYQQRRFLPSDRRGASVPERAGTRGGHFPRDLPPAARQEPGEAGAAEHGHAAGRVHEARHRDVPKGGVKPVGVF